MLMTITCIFVIVACAIYIVKAIANIDRRIY